MKKYALIVAGGIGNRMNTDIPKQFLELSGLPILMHTIQKFEDCEEIIITLPEEQVNYWYALCDQHDFQIKHQIVNGGPTRFQSVKNGLELVKEDSLVAIHDGVRPFVSKEIISRSFELAEQIGNAITSVPVKDSLRQIADAKNKHVDRGSFRIIQTPQTFLSSLIKKAYETKEQEIFTDDASVLENYGEPINLMEGDYKNIKITTKEDLAIGSALLSL